MDDLEFLNPQGLLHHPVALLSAGHADLEGRRAGSHWWYKKKQPGITRITDSGGFQLAVGTWLIEVNETNPKFLELRQRIFQWQQQHSDYAVTLDLPSTVFLHPRAVAATGARTFQDCITAAQNNNRYYLENSTGQCRWLNALQGRTFQECDTYYQALRADNQPAPDRDHCRGWAFGGIHTWVFAATLRRIIDIKFDGLLDTTERIHMLGRSRLEHTLAYNLIQQHIPEVPITYDSASPYLMAAKGQILTGWRLDERMTMTSQPIPWKPSDLSVSQPATVKYQGQPSKIIQLLDQQDIIVTDKNRSGLDTLSYVLLQHHNVDVMLQSQQAVAEAWSQGYRNQQFTMHPDIENIVADILQAATRQQAHQLLERYNTRQWLGKISPDHTNVSEAFDRLFVVE